MPSYTGIIISPYCIYLHVYIYIVHIYVGMSYVTGVLDVAHTLSGIS